MTGVNNTWLGAAKHFYSHARVGRDAGAGTNGNGGDNDFYSHARVGRDRHWPEKIILLAISTHTPA